MSRTSRSTEIKQFNGGGGLRKWELPLKDMGIFWGDEMLWNYSDDARTTLTILRTTRSYT